jgi:hypothetical protein
MIEFITLIGFKKFFSFKRVRWVDKSLNKLGYLIPK